MTEEDTFRLLKRTNIEIMVANWHSKSKPRKNPMKEFRCHVENNGWTIKEYLAALWESDQNAHNNFSTAELFVESYYRLYD